MLKHLWEVHEYIEYWWWHEVDAEEIPQSGEDIHRLPMDAGV